MKLPINCPFCQDVMITDFTIRFDFPIKQCIKHAIKFVADRNDEVTSIQLIILPSTKVTYISWSFMSKALLIESIDNAFCLPFFEPDFSLGYKALVAKINTLLLFS